MNRHPRALPFLFLTEMWERFGFYVVNGMLVLYMSKEFGYTDDASYTIMGAFLALAYIAPFLGGSLADQLLGFKTATVWGGLFLSSGYALLAFWQNGFFLALATIIIGNGLLKPSISSFLGSLYEHGDPHRESGFTLFYIGINTGIVLAGLSSGYIKDHFGWQAGFALASVGLIIGLFTFGLGLKRIDVKTITTHALPPVNRKLKCVIILSCILAAAIVSELLQNSLLAKWLLPSAGIILLIFLLTLTLKQDAENRRQLFTLHALILSSIVFWMMYWQMFFSVNLFIDRLIDKELWGIHIPITVFYTLEAIFVILLGPSFAWSWQTLNRSSRNPSSFSKFVLAIVFVGLGFLTLGISTYFANANHLIHPAWVLVAYFFIAVGEMLLSPIGLSAVTSLAPRKLVGMMMGIWFVALGFGGAFAGWLAKLSNIPENITQALQQLAIYQNAFLDYAYIAFAVAFLLFLLQLFLKKVIRVC